MPRLEEVAQVIVQVFQFFDFYIDHDSALKLAAIIVFGSLAFTTFLIVYNLILWLRRALGDDHAISSEQATAVRLIVKELDQVKKSIEGFSEKLNHSIAGQFQSLNDRLKEAADNDDDADDQETTGDPVKSVRRFFAEQVRDAVMSKFQQGHWFTETKDRHVYEFTGTTASGREITITLGTPYRLPHNDEGALDYTLDVRSGTKRLVSFQWDFENLRPPVVSYLAHKRDWVEEITNWTFLLPGEAVKTAVGQ